MSNDHEEQKSRLSVDRMGQKFGPYEITKFLGQGGFADVFLGRNMNLPEQQVAIKVLDKLMIQFDKVQQFKNEAAIILSLHHPSIIRFYTYDIYFNPSDTNTAYPYIVMEYCAKGSLLRNHPRGWALPLETIATYVQQISSALYYVHGSQVLHLDVKPANILINSQGKLLLSDFGLSTLVTGKKPEEIQGTLSYMAPEQMIGNPDKASDQYSLAVMVYEWICGSLPFTARSFDEYIHKLFHEQPLSLLAKVPTLPPAVEAVVMKALSKNVRDRYPSVLKFAEYLENAITHPEQAASAVPNIGSPTAFHPAGSLPLLVGRPPAASVPSINGPIGITKSGAANKAADSVRAAPEPQKLSSFIVEQSPSVPVSIAKPPAVSASPISQPVAMPDPQTANEAVDPVGVGSDLQVRSPFLSGVPPDALGDSFWLGEQSEDEPSPLPSANIASHLPLSDESMTALVDFFISYNKFDRNWAIWVAMCLSQVGYSVHVPPTDFRDGCSFRDELQEARTKAKRMIIVFSPKYLNVLKSHEKGLHIFRRVIIDKRKLVLLINVINHEQTPQELYGKGNFIDISEELSEGDNEMAQAIFFAFIMDRGLDITSSVEIGNNMQTNALKQYSMPTFQNVNENLLRQMKVSFTKKIWLDVVRKADLLIERSPALASTEVYRKHGLAHFELGHKELAYGSLQRALAFASEQEMPGLLEDCLKILKTLESWDEILNLTREALKLEPQSPLWLMVQQQTLTQIENGKPIVDNASIQKPSPPQFSPTNKLEVFISYSHKDERLKRELEKHLFDLKNHYNITAWHDGEIKPGDKWEEAINQHLSSANIILLLISKDFLSSEYCRIKEMEKAIERHESRQARVIPIILRPSHWELSPFKHLKVLPEKGKALALWDNRDQACVDIVTGIQIVVEDLLRPNPA